LFWWYSSYLDKELRSVREETERIEQELSISRAYTKQVKDELRAAKAAAQADINKANETIAYLTASVIVTKESLKKEIAGKQVLLDEIRTLKIESIPDAPMPEIIAKAQEIYPFQNLSGVEITANEPGRGLLQLMLSEVEKSREVLVIDSQIQNDYQDQVYRLEIIIDNHELKFAALSDVNNFLENTNQALTLENNQYIKLTQSQEKQLKIYAQKDRVKWPVVGSKVVAGLAALGIIILAVK